MPSLARRCPVQGLTEVLMTLCLSAFWRVTPYEIAQFVSTLPPDACLTRQCLRASVLRHELSDLRRRAECCAGRLSHAEAQALVHDVGTAAEALSRVGLPVLCELARACRCRLASRNMGEDEREAIAFCLELLDGAALSLHGTIVPGREASDVRLAARRFRADMIAVTAAELRRKP